LLFLLPWKTDATLADDHRGQGTRHRAQRQGRGRASHLASSTREEREKVAFYKNLCEELERACGISPSDVVVTIFDISDDGWSLGLGRAQLIDLGSATVTAGEAGDGRNVAGESELI
jgi:hypothetical protein